jgi:hypothetical protein
LAGEAKAGEVSRDGFPLRFKPKAKPHPSIGSEK